MSGFGDFVVALVSIILGLRCLDIAADARNWPVQIAWVLVTALLFLFAFAVVAS